MGDISIVKSSSLHFVAQEIGVVVITNPYLKEMNEPICWTPEQSWYIAYIDGGLVGFICHDNDTIKYAYTITRYRNKGVFLALYNEIPEQTWKVVASNMSLPIYQKLGFKIIKSYKICHKLIKS